MKITRRGRLARGIVTTLAGLIMLGYVGKLDAQDAEDHSRPEIEMIFADK